MKPKPDPPPRPKQLSRPELQAAEVDRTVGGASNQRRFDDPRRRQTNPGGMMAMPPTPALPLEHARTVPAAAHGTATQRAPTPVAVQVVRIEDAPEGLPAAATLPPPSQNPEQATIHALRVELEAYRTGKKKPETEPPPSRGAWRKLGFKLATAMVGSLVLVVGALGFLGVTWVNAKAEAIKAEEAAKAELERDRNRNEREWRKAVTRVLDCRHRKQSELNARQFPESQRPAATGWPIWKDECGELPKP